MSKNPQFFLRCACQVRKFGCLTFLMWAIVGKFLSFIVCHFCVSTKIRFDLKNRT